VKRKKLFYYKSTNFSRLEFSGQASPKPWWQESHCVIECSNVWWRKPWEGLDRHGTCLCRVRSPNGLSI